MDRLTNCDTALKLRERGLQLETPMEHVMHHIYLFIHILPGSEAIDVELVTCAFIRVRALLSRCSTHCRTKPVDYACYISTNSMIDILFLRVVRNSQYFHILQGERARERVSESERERERARKSERERTSTKA